MLRHKHFPLHFAAAFLLSVSGFGSQILVQTSFAVLRRVTAAAGRLPRQEAGTFGAGAPRLLPFHFLVVHLQEWIHLVVVVVVVVLLHLQLHTLTSGAGRRHLVTLR